MANNLYLRWDGSWVPVGEITAPPPSDSEPTPQPPPDPGGWADAVATRNYSVVEDWYAANTGHEALGLTKSSLTPGSLESTHDGQVFEGIIGSHIRIGHDNVTYRGCRVVNGAQYGAYFSPTFGAAVRGAVIEYCTFEFNDFDPEPTSQTLGVLLFPGNLTDTATVRFCNLFGWPGTACRPGNGVTFEYSWVHDLTRFSGIHHNSARIRGNNAAVKRCYLTDGSSGICSLYFDDVPMNNITVQENIMNGSSPQASPSYLMNFKSGEWGPPAQNIKILGNYWGRDYQYGVMSGGNVPWGSQGNERTGNQWFDTGELAFN